MLYTKPKDVRYVDMCIFIDNKVKEGNPSKEDIDLIFEYLYHLSFMLAHKHKYFNESHYYEEFAIYFATEIMYRLFYNPKLGKTDENGDPLLAPIKSVLNYMKAIIYGRKCAFEATNYSQKIVKEKYDFNYSSNINSKLKDSLIYNIETDIEIYLKTLSKEIKNIVYSSFRHKNEKVLLKNIYISCLLSIVNSFTFTEVDIENIDSTYSLPESKYNYINRLYKRNRDQCVILYNLPDIYYNYIKITVNRIFNKLHDDIVYLTKNDIEIPNDILSELIYLELDGVNGFNN